MNDEFMEKYETKDLLESTKAKLEVLDGAKAYTQLRQDVMKAGILDRAYGFYAITSLIVFSGFFFTLYMIYITSLSLALAFWSLVLGVFIVQIGGLIHDSGHRAIFNSSKMNDILGNFCGFLVGMGYYSWNLTHNKHHAHTNEEDEDPDLELPLHSFTRKRLKSEKGIWKLLSRYQAYLYFPLRTVVSFSRRWSNVAYFKKKKSGEVWWEIILWSLGMFFWFILPFIIFPFSKAIVIFVLVHISTGFYMSNIFAPNHKGMPQIPKGTKISFLEHQIMTSRNVYNNWFNDTLYIGLNFQIEHHLFPNCPRNKLHKITPYVLEICKKMNLEYTQVGIIESNRIILSELNRVAKSN